MVRELEEYLGSPPWLITMGCGDACPSRTRSGSRWSGCARSATGAQTHRDFTHVLLVTLPEATPIHEAMQLERDLARADIKPFAWIVNQSLTPLDVKDAVLRSRQAHEATHLRELADHPAHIVLEPWSVGFVAGEPRAEAPRAAEAVA